MSSYLILSAAVWLTASYASVEVEQDGIDRSMPICKNRSCVFVSADYEETGNGSRGTPYNSLADVEHHSKEGDVIIVLNARRALVLRN